MFFNNFLSTFYFYVRPLMKWFLHKFTKLSELQRICYGAKPGAARTLGVEKSLELSRTLRIKNLLNMLNDMIITKINNEDFLKVCNASINTILLVKKIDPRIHNTFPRTFGKCIELIWSYKSLFYYVENLRTMSYDCDNMEHEKKLYELWDLLMPDTKLESRITKQWQDIGFQGEDPKTDFRGMGLLGLENLLYFAREYNGAALHVLSHSHHPQHGYTFAIVGINLTSMAYRLLKIGAAKTHIYNYNTKTNAPNIDPNIKLFHKLYCYLFYEFDRYWMKCKPKSIMDFAYIQEKFETNILKELADEDALLKINLFVDRI